ncbi:hypothetical protein [Shimazuella kribbensis]|uniref:hypothetical protein n=1 Tax=Shimazuella kribbensis TaxID=139808 RepID=UPI000414302B|nr:hypothetical protein [Shimazuella kribbensis]
MAKTSGFSRLKTNQDTTFIPDAGGGIYFRNNKHSFRMSGTNVYQWMEKLIPMFDGTHRMHEITDGLPEIYQKRVYEFADILLQNEFVRDVSKDDPHSLREDLVQSYSTQISYLDHQSGSGASRFEKYRQSNLLVIGSGSFLLSLLSSLLDSGIQTIHLFITDAKSTNKQRIHSLITAANKKDTCIQIVDISDDQVQPWKKVLQPFDSVLFVGKEDQIEILHRLSHICEQENKKFFPAITWKQFGIVGPSKDWDSAWRRLNTPEEKGNITNHAATALLANVLAFQYFKSATTAQHPEKSNVFLLDLKTLEGKWHTYLSHPLAYHSKPFIQPLEQSKWFSSSKQKKSNLLGFFHHITSSKMGIFRSFGPENSLQLPLSQCHVQINDPHNENEISPIVCAGDSHHEAQRETGLAGIEAYASRLLSNQDISVPLHIGAGENSVEAIFRGFQNYLYQFHSKSADPTQPFLLHSEQIEDEQAYYYAKCLETYGVQPIISFGKRLYGFDTIWININNHWFSGMGWDLSTSLRNALKKALHTTQNTDIPLKKTSHELPVCSTLFPKPIDISMESKLKESIQSLSQHNLQLQVFDIMLETYIRQHLSIVGVMIGETKS